ncbi:MAG: sulfatase-like hydrolase/transferase [Bacteroidota bacterium]
MSAIRRELHYFLELLLRLSAVLLVFMFIRTLFYIINADHFPAVGTSEFLLLLFWGIRFDWAAVIYINALLILSALVPLKQRQTRRYSYFQYILFLLFNGGAFIFELSDIAYYPYAFRRSLSSDLTMLSKSANLLPCYLLDYWYLVIAMLVFLYFLHRFFEYSRLRKPLSQKSLYQYLLFPLLALFFLVGARGGWQLRPLMPITATQYVQDMRLAPLQSNSTLNLLFSLQQRQLEPTPYLSQEEVQALCPIYISPSPTAPMRKDNVLIIALESFGQENVGYYRPDQTSYTPFLDSLLQLSYTSPKSFASGLRSTEGIAAITCGLPALMEDPFIFSAYQSNQVQSMAALLGKKGYQSAFFHGANSGSMEFERFARLSGFQDFYDRKRYDNDADYDGQWGIWDLPFFEYTAQQINQFKGPFVALLFSLSSHHPYQVEPWFEKKYPNLSAPDRSRLYTDMALRQFFETARQMPWFNQTLFVLTADHIGPASHPSYYSRTWRYRIPIAFYHPNHQWPQQDPDLIQQIDILPSILDYLHYDLPYTTFGQSVFDSLSTSHAYMFGDGLYQIVDSTHIMVFRPFDEHINLYDYRQDPTLQHPLNMEYPVKVKAMEQKLKAVIQQYRQVLIDNSWLENQ